MAKQQPQAGAAQTAAPRQTAATAGEAGLPITQPAPDPDAEIKALLQRNGLPKAYRDEAGNVHFDAVYVATLSGQTLTEISAD